jgi:hypothetical protein
VVDPSPFNLEVMVSRRRGDSRDRRHYQIENALLLLWMMLQILGSYPKVSVEALLLERVQGKSVLLRRPPWKQLKADAGGKCLASSERPQRPNGLSSAPFVNQHTARRPEKIAHSSQRRQLFHKSLVVSLSIISSGATVLGFHSTFWAHAMVEASASSNPITKDQVARQFEEIQNSLQELINHWEAAVIDCTYADVPRELLATENKSLLLEKAATSALFDKSASVVSCKTTNRVVRDYLGLNGNGPLAGAALQLPRLTRQGLDLILLDGNMDESIPETYVTATEELQQTLSRATSLSYAAGTIADLNAIQNFSPDSKSQALSSEANPNLAQCKDTIESAIKLLSLILHLLR